MANRNMHRAKDAKKDEFYTQLSDIEKELRHYKDHFKDKIVFCNCDDPYESNFFKYFAMNFNYLGLKKLITTCYAGSPIVTEQLSLFDVEGLVLEKNDNKKPYKIEINEVLDYNKDGAVDLADVEYLIKNKKNTLSLLEGDGDFRSKEAVKLLKEADIVVTNPPFSLYREFIEQLMKFKKNFLIIGNYNSITYKNVFSYLQENKIWTGISPRSMSFIVPGGDIKKVNAKWFTNLDNINRHEKMILYKKYNTEDYVKYDNYDAININKVSDIPYDYDGIMGVPITFLEKYNPNQFKIMGITDRQNTSGLRTKKYTEADSPRYNDLNARSVILENGEYKALYARVLIQRIDKEEEHGN